MNKAFFVETEHIVLDGVERVWFLIYSDDNPEYNRREYAITSDGELLAHDGCPINQDDFEGTYVLGLIREYYELHYGILII